MNTFEDHISKSVPFYNQGHDLICQLSDFFIKTDSYCYELGSSTGILSHKLADHAGDQKGKFIGIDSVEDMVDFAKKADTAKNRGFVLEEPDIRIRASRYVYFLLSIAIYSPFTKAKFSRSNI